MNDQTPFTFDSQEIRTVLIDGKPWFVAKDICHVLAIANHRDAVFHLPDDMKNRATCKTRTGHQQMAVVSQEGANRIILSSKKPERIRFADWIASLYEKAEKEPESAPPAATDEMNRILEDLTKRISRLEKTLPPTWQVGISSSEGSWRETIHRMINGIIQVAGFDHGTYRSTLYRWLEVRARVDLTARLRNLRFRLFSTGKTRTEVNNSTKLDVIEAEPALREIFEKIVTEQYIRLVSRGNDAA